MTAPLGVKIICVLGVITASLTVLLSVPIMFAGGPFVGVGMAFLVLGLVHFVVVYGLWTVQPWGWTWGMIVFGLAALADIAQGQALGLIISVIILGYLYTKKDVYRR